MKKKKTTKKKVILYTILILCAVAILVYDTYQIHFSGRKRDTVEHLTVEYENAGNILLSNIKNGSSTSLKIKIKNNTEESIYYKVSFIDVVNPLSYKSSLTYTFSKEEGNVEIHSDIFPSENIVINDGDEVDPGEELDYVITIRANNLEETDLNKSIQASIQILEVKP